jgi:hypothetical protein
LGIEIRSLAIGGGAGKLGGAMRTRLFGTILVAVLAAGCATESKTDTEAHHTIYTKPLTSPGAKFGALPPTVQRTVLAEAGPAEVVDAVRDTSSGKVVYKIYFRDSEVFPPLFVAPDGSVLNPDLTVAVSAGRGTRVKLQDVPVKVLKAIPEHAPASEVATIYKETWHGQTIYVVVFKDEAHNPKLLVSSEGNIVEEAE